MVVTTKKFLHFEIKQNQNRIINFANILLVHLLETIKILLGHLTRDQQ